MAMIKCPKCGKSISDKAEVCPGCGWEVELLETELVEEEKESYLCEECGNTYDKKLGKCPECGCPVQKDILFESPQKVEVTNIKLSMDKKKKKTLIVSLIAAVLVIVFAAVGMKVYTTQQANKDREEYLTNLQSLSSEILSGASKAEEAGKLIHDVWYNTIYSESDTDTDEFTKPYGYFVSDFNTALTYLFADSSFQEEITEIKSVQSSAQSLMKKLQNPPKGYEEAYQAAKDLYDSYTEFSNLVVSPSGSLTTYTQNYNQSDSEVLNYYKAMQLYLD